MTRVGQVFAVLSVPKWLVGPAGRKLGKHSESSFAYAWWSSGSVMLSRGILLKQTQQYKDPSSH